VGYLGLRGSDSYIDYNFLKGILQNGHFRLEYDVYGVKAWPILHIFSSVNTLIPSIDSMIIAKYLPSFISSFIVLPLYLLIKEVYSNEKRATFSLL
jgi:asparagine N-glycosylation enzyme membrane subunit Stt3